jgi:hypothetical protein
MKFIYYKNRKWLVMDTLKYPAISLLIDLKRALFQRHLASARRVRRIRKSIMSGNHEKIIVIKINNLSLRDDIK